MRVVAPPYPMELWEVARVDTARLPEERSRELFAWLAEWQIPYRQCIPHLVITRDSHSGQYLLHLSRFVLDAFGQKIVDHAANRVHTEPAVFGIDDSYPAWLVEVSQQQKKEVEP